MNSAARLWRLAATDDPEEENGRNASKPLPKEEDDLSFRVEIWNYSGTVVEQTLAMTNSRSVGIAAYYAALQQFSEGLITLRHKEVVIARWNARKH